MLLSREIKQLILQLSSGNKRENVSAYKKLYDHYFRRFMQYAAFKIDHAMDAEDLVQDLLANLWTERGTLADLGICDKEGLEQHLFSKLTGNIQNFNKKSQKLVSIDHTLSSDMDLLDFFVDFVEDTDASFDKKEFEHVLYNVVKQRFPDYLRHVFYLIKEKNYSLDDTARTLGISKTTVKKYHKRVNKQIEKEIKKYYRLD